MNLTYEIAADVLIVRIGDDRIDAASAIQFKEAMRGIVQVPSSRVLLDMSKVSFLDSSGLGAIVAVMKLIGTNRKLELAGLTPTVTKVMHLTRMDTVLRIHNQLPVVQGLRNAG